MRISIDFKHILQEAFSGVLDQVKKDDFDPAKIPFYFMELIALFLKREDKIEFFKVMKERLELEIEKETAWIDQYNTARKNTENVAFRDLLDEL